MVHIGILIFFLHAYRVMAMYYPQATTIELGPTGILPGSQYFYQMDPFGKEDSILLEQWGTKELPLVCKAGTVVIIHYDIWHRGLFNSGKSNR
jgi:hypothetical protein